MKKVLPILLALSMAVPALATVTISAVDGGNEDLVISYSCDAGEVVRGIALKLTIVDAELTTGTDVAANALLNAYIDYYYTNGVSL